MNNPGASSPESSPPARPETSAGWFRASWLYRLLLRGPAPRGVLEGVPVLWPGSPERGAQLLEGRFTFAGETHHLHSADQLPRIASREWLAWFHGLSWLTDLAALSGGQHGGEAPYFAREWVSTWVGANTHFEPIAWAPEVAAQRIIHVISTWTFLVRDDAAGPFEKTLRATLGRDMRHITKSPPPPGSGYARLLTLKGQAYAALALKGRERHQPKVLARLEDEINAQVLPDGGHIERNPQRMADVLRDLLELKALIAAATGQMSGCVQNAIDRAAPMLRQLRHPDGGLALFNGGLEGVPAEIDLLLAQTDPGAQAPGRAPYAGFQRLNTGSAVVIMDCGCPSGVGKRQHAGTLSFEMSVGAQRVIVNCGARPGAADPWRTALAATAAHSTLTVNDTSSAAFTIDGDLHRGPEHITCSRTGAGDGGDGVLVEANHDGYQAPFSLIHHRALFLGPGGDDIRGEDRLTGTGGEYYTIRFHLHPTVKASILGDGTGALLRFGTRTKQTWRLRVSAGELSLESSVYLGQGGEHRRCEQIVITGPLTGNGVLVKWALSRVDP